VTRSIAFLVATHELEFARRACHRAVLLQDGRLIDRQVDIGALEARWTELGDD